MPIKFKAEASGDLEIEMYDVIGFWGTSAKDFSSRLKAAKGKNVTLRINSPGGSTMEGTAIYNLLKAHPGKVTAYIDGMAASMAGVIAMAASHIVMPENTFIMIHNPSVLGEGESDDLRKMADLLDKIKENLVSAYEAKTGKSRTIISEWMDDESWFTAAECKALGLCDEVTTALEAAACAKHSAYFPGNKRFAAFAPTLPPIIPNGGQQIKPNKDKTMKVYTAEEAQALAERVANLEREQTSQATAHATALTNAKNAALQEATTAVTAKENKRRADIKALADKYDKDGDLGKITVTALSGDTTPEAFKDLVLDAVQSRVTTNAIKPGKAKEDGKEEGTGDAVADFITAYKACKSDRDRRALVRSDRLLAKQAMRQIEE